VQPVSKADVDEFNIYPNRFFSLTAAQRNALLAHPLKPIQEEPDLNHCLVERTLRNGDSIKYFGQFQGEVPTGRGQLQFVRSGDLWVCNFMFSEAYGIGQVYFANGDYFEGDINKTQFKKGKLFYHTGEVYDGPFENGAPTGKGTLKYTDGSFYQGDIVNGKRHGAGKHIWVDGSSVEGTFNLGEQLPGCVHISAAGVRTTQ